MLVSRRQKRTEDVMMLGVPPEPGKEVCHVIMVSIVWNLCKNSFEFFVFWILRSDFLLRWDRKGLVLLCYRELLQ